MKYYREEKPEFERFLIFPDKQMSAKSKKIELNEEFIALWTEEQSLWKVFHVALHTLLVCTWTVYFCEHEINVASQRNYVRLLVTEASQEVLSWQELHHILFLIFSFFVFFFFLRSAINIAAAPFSSESMIK